ncbi:MAG: hypothetical protein GXN99_00885 [Candidatus Nanohaloarchaeota archaeon]|nr:hypothetical protein [Candidatus Nanohaloarchaeota archaeon]
MGDLINISLLALVDSINPCTLAVQSLLLASIIVKYDKKRAIISGLLFSLTVFFAYLLYGLGILKVVSFFNSSLLRAGVNVLLIVMIVAEINGYLGAKGFKAMEMPLFLRRHAKRLLSNASSYGMVILTAFLISIFLLPCSSGPYLTALSMMKEGSLTSLGVLIYYNFIFILPMILITLLVGYGSSPKSIMKWKEKHIGLLHLISAVLLFAVLIYYNFSFVSPSQNVEGNKALYVISSPTCPHCINLKNDLKQVSANIIYVSPTSTEAYKIQRLVPEWSGGVPLMVCLTSDKPLVMIGYPSATQEKDGYFLGEEQEKEICRSQQGKEIYDGNKYLYCVLPNGFIIGNEYALNYLLEVYRNQGCKKLTDSN